MVPRVWFTYPVTDITLEKTEFRLATRNQLQIDSLLGIGTQVHSPSQYSTWFSLNLWEFKHAAIVCGFICAWIPFCQEVTGPLESCTVPEFCSLIFLPLLHRPLSHKGQGFMRIFHLRISDPKPFTPHVFLSVGLC